MRTQRKSFRVFAAAGILSIGVAGSALADSQERLTTVHGSICQPQDFGTGTRISYTQFGVSNNSTVAPMQVFCAIPLSTRKTFSRMGVSGISDCLAPNASNNPWVEVFDRSAAGDVQCTLLVIKKGNVATVVSTAQSSGNRAGFQKLIFPLSSRIDIEDKQVFVKCSIPRKEADWSFVTRFIFPTCETDRPVPP
jgi:hypothetical protein